MVGQLNRISETLKAPDKIIQAKTDKTVELFYNHYKTTPVSDDENIALSPKSGLF
jgi:hypothetical protein